MAADLQLHFVAFLDILGFSDMVVADINGGDQKNLITLFHCHQSAAQFFSDDFSCSISQFSDSIVIAKPYHVTGFKWFVERIARYQRLLLSKGLLCRGGVAVNKHFSNGTFTFSAGLIDAYRVESQTARYPRVVISKELIDLLFPTMRRQPPYLLKENDGVYFVDFIGLSTLKQKKSLRIAITTIVTSLLKSENPSIKEKALWLAAYSDEALDTKLCPPRFSK